MKKTSALLMVLLTGMAYMGATVQAQEHNHQHHDEYEYHEKHVHGVAELMMAVEGHKLEIHFQSPAMNLIGFEHEPETPEQQQKLLSAVKILRQAHKLFYFSGKAGCELEKADVHAPFKEDHREHDGEVHADFSGYYHYHCKDTSRLTGLDVGVFEYFPLTEKITVQALTEKGQHAFDLHPGQHLIDL